MASAVARSFLLPATVLFLAVLRSAAAGVEGGTAAAASLLEFKSALRDADGHLSTWNAAAADGPCGWAGVTCSPSGGEVTGVTLHGLNLHGSLSASLCGGALPRLAVLNVSRNALSGPIPPGLAGCAALEVLDLSTNALRGGVPPELCGLPSLRRLFLSENLLSGEIPLMKLLNL
ncbi:unnamed protein product [Urochloa humidicola]